MTVWGLVAFAAWAGAIFLANVSAVVPADIFGALHASRLQGSTMNQLRTQVAEIRAESDRMRQENTLLLQRFARAEEARGDVTRRVGALEISVPQLAERVPERAGIDNSVTASIFDSKPFTFDAEGGSVSVSTRPLVALTPGTAATAPADLAPPEALVLADGSRFGVALGFPVAASDSEMMWQDLLGKVGTLLIGLWPVTTDAEGSEGKSLIAGPIETETQAAELCGRLDRVGIPCAPVPFKGELLPMLN